MKIIKLKDLYAITPIEAMQFRKMSRGEAIATYQALCRIHVERREKERKDSQQKDAA